MREEETKLTTKLQQSEINLKKMEKEKNENEKRIENIRKWLGCSTEDEDEDCITDNIFSRLRKRKIWKILLQNKRK